MKGEYLFETLLGGDTHPSDLSEALYSLKVYKRPDVPNSVGKLEGSSVKKQFIFNMNEAIDFLYERYKGKMTKTIIDIEQVNSIGKGHDLVFNSIRFMSRPREYVNTFVHTFSCKCLNNIVYYNIDPGNPVIRYGVVFDEAFIESTTELYPGSKCETKVNSIDPDKFNDNIIPIGRYGEWNKLVLSHDVYYKVRKVLNG